MEAGESRGWDWCLERASDPARHKPGEPRSVGMCLSLVCTQVYLPDLPGVSSLVGQMRLV